MSMVFLAWVQIFFSGIYIHRNIVILAIKINYFLIKIYKLMFKNYERMINSIYLVMLSFNG